MKKYRVICKRGRYYPEKKSLLSWTEVKITDKGYNFEDNFKTRIEAMSCIYIYHYGNYWNESFEIEEEEKE